MCIRDRKEGAAFGSSTIGGGRKTLVEYVSANPTGPLHVGHGRGAAAGDSLARILRRAGYDVTTEYLSLIHIYLLEKAGIRTTPCIIVTTHDDDANIYLTLYTRRLRPDAQIISRASLDRNINGLHMAGADVVLSLSSLVSSTIMNLLLPDRLLMLNERLVVFCYTIHGLSLIHISSR